MNHYETIFIVDPDTPGPDQDTIFEKTKALIDRSGSLIVFDDWGNRKLAYEIKKKRQGRYVRLEYCGDGVLVAEMERNFRLDYRILKFMTILLAQDMDPSALTQTAAEPSVEAEEPSESLMDAEEAAFETSDEATDSETIQPETDTEA